MLQIIMEIGKSQEVIDNMYSLYLMFFLNKLVSVTESECSI